MMRQPETLLWKSDWAEARQAHTRWWNGQGMVLWLTADLPTPREDLPEPGPAASEEDRWLNPERRISLSEYGMARTAFLAESFPQADIQIGPGSLGTFLGAEPGFAPDTVWYTPCIHDPDTYGPVRFEPRENRWLEAHLAVIDEALRRARGRYLVGIPDLIENLDTLAALRGDTPLLYDLIERPQWVLEKLAEINLAFAGAYEIIYDRIRAEDGATVFNPFNLWAPGRVCKVQCDISATLSPAMFRKFVIPYLEEQCAQLDYVLYHLDGTTCLQHTEALLETRHLRAIEYTPQAGLEGGGSPRWYGLYKRIKAAGKGVQVVGVLDDELEPLLDAIGPQGTYVMMDGGPRTLDQAERLLKAVEPYRRTG
jgi:hypothetical protein